MTEKEKNIYGAGISRGYEMCRNDTKKRKDNLIQIYKNQFKKVLDVLYNEPELF